MQLIFIWVWRTLLQMELLIVEDDEIKFRQIYDFLKAELHDLNITKRKSYQSGLKEIISYKYDLIILDMSMPTYDITSTESGEPYRAFAGKEILSEMKRKKVSARTIIVTQFENFGQDEDITTLEELKNTLYNCFPQTYKGTVFYSAAESNWKDELRLLLRESKP